MWVKVWFGVVHHQAAHCLSSRSSVSASCVSGHAAVTGCTYKWSVETGHSTARRKWNWPQTCHRQTCNNTTWYFFWFGLRYMKKETTSCMFNSILPDWVSVSQSDQKGEIWDREFLKHWFAYTNETSYNWWELIFFSCFDWATIESELLQAENWLIWGWIPVYLV